MEQATTNLFAPETEKQRSVPIPSGYVDAIFIDEGGMGLVFRALELSTGRTVALKMLQARRMSDDMIARFSVEAKALAALREAEQAGWRGPGWRYYRDLDPNLASIRNEPEFKAVFADIERDMAHQRAELAKRPKDAPLDLGESRK